MTKGYTTTGRVEVFLNLPASDIDSDDLEPYILAAEKLIDQITGRNFKADSEVSARLYDGDGSQELIIDDAVAVTKVEQGQDSYGSSFTEISNSGSDKYFLYPENYTVKGVPVYKISLNTRFWVNGRQNHRVTAKWGYSVSVPDDIAFAATVIAAGIYNYNRGGTGNVVSERIGNYSVSYDKENENALADFRQAMSILDTYKKVIL